VQAQVETEAIALSCGIETGQRKDAIPATTECPWVDAQRSNCGAVGVVMMSRPQGFDEPITFETRLGEDTAHRLPDQCLELWSRESGQRSVRQELVEADDALTWAEADREHSCAGQVRQRTVELGRGDRAVQNEDDGVQ